MRRLIIYVAFIFGLVLASGPVAFGSPPVSCPPGQEPNPKTGACIIVVTPKPPPSDPTDPGDGGGSSTEPTKKVVCRFTLGTAPREVPCSTAQGWWVQSQQCYAKAASPQPAKSDPVWQGHTDGAIYDCYHPALGPGGFIVSQFWSASPPGVGAPPDPAQLARRAIAVMNLHAVRIGIVPEARPGRVGLVGMPVWMWADAPDPATWGPVTKSASTGGYTVTATAKVNRVVWGMGDGEVVACRSPGTKYEDRYGKQFSPDCGYSYERSGHFRVRATSYWQVDWSGMGQSGTIPLSFTDSVLITVGEVQVLRQ